MIAGYAQRPGQPDRIPIGEGIVGQCAVGKQRILLSDVPPHYTSISSSLGQATPSSIVVLDLRLPDINGFELLKRFQAEPALRDLPVVVFTGRELSSDDEMRLKSMAKSIVLKDVQSPEQLLDETALFLHRVVTDLPVNMQMMLERLHGSNEILNGRKVLVVDECQPSPPGSKRPTTSSFDDEPISILLVDDEPKNLILLETVLTCPSFRLVSARSADQALLTSGCPMLFVTCANTRSDLNSKPGVRLQSSFLTPARMVSGSTPAAWFPRSLILAWPSLSLESPRTSPSGSGFWKACKTLTGARTNSWPRSRTSFAIRSRRSEAAFRCLAFHKAPP